MIPRWSAVVRGLVAVSASLLAVRLDAAVDLQLEAGVSRTRLEGEDMLLGGFLPAAMWMPGTMFAPVVGLRAGGLGMTDADGRRAFAVEARILLGGVWRPAPDVEAMALGSWGFDRWRDDGLGLDGRGRVVGVEGGLGWMMSDRVRLGPWLGWSGRSVGDRSVEDWRAAISVAYRFVP